MKYFSIYPSPELDPTGFAQLLRAELVAQKFLESASLEKTELFLALDHPRVLSKTWRWLRASKCRKVLLRFEPEAVNPILYRRKVMDLYNIVLSVGGTQHKGIPPQVIRWPYFSHPNPARPSREKIHNTNEIAKDSSPAGHKSIGISFIASNKVAWSKNSNYGLRRDVALKSMDMGITSFGMGWQESRISKLRQNLRLLFFFFSQGVFPNPKHVFENLSFGKLSDINPIPDKFDVLQDSQIHLIIENSSSYVSEKLLDALISGAVPMYVGPDLTPYGIPPECVITPKNELGDLQSTISDFSQIDLNFKKSRIRALLDSSDFLKLWQPSVVARSIIRVCV